MADVLLKALNATRFGVLQDEETVRSGHAKIYNYNYSYCFYFDSIINGIGSLGFNILYKDDDNCFMEKEDGLVTVLVLRKSKVLRIVLSDDMEDFKMRIKTFNKTINKEV